MTWNKIIQVSKRLEKSPSYIKGKCTTRTAVERAGCSQDILFLFGQVAVNSRQVLDTCGLSSAEFQLPTARVVSVPYYSPDRQKGNSKYSLLSKRVASKNGFVIVRNVDLISFFLPGNKCFLQGMPKINNTL